MSKVVGSACCSRAKVIAEENGEAPAVDVGAAASLSYSQVLLKPTVLCS